MGLFGRTRKGQYYPKDPMRLSGNNRTGGTGNALTRLTGKRIQNYAERKKEEAKLKATQRDETNRNLLLKRDLEAKKARKEQLRVSKAKLNFLEINDPEKGEKDLEGYMNEITNKVFFETDNQGNFKVDSSGNPIPKNDYLKNRWQDAQMYADSIDESSKTQRDEKLKLQKKADDILKTAMNDEDKDVLDILRNRLTEYWGNTYSRRATPEQRKNYKSALGQDMPSSGGKLLESGMDESRISRYTPEQLQYFASLLSDKDGSELEKIALKLQGKKIKDLDKITKKFEDKLDKLERLSESPSPEVQQRIAMVLNVIDRVEREYKMREEEFALAEKGLSEKIGYVPESREEKDKYIREFREKLKEGNRSKQFKEFVPPTAEDIAKRERILARYGGGRRRAVSIDSEI